MRTIGDSPDIPDFNGLVAMAAYAPEEVIEKCRKFAETLTEKSVVLTVAKILIASTFRMEDRQARDKLPEIFNILFSTIDSWDEGDKKWFGRHAAQACANTHQMAAKYLTEVPASLRVISSMIDLHTQRKQSEVIDFLQAAAVLAARDAESRYGKYAPSCPSSVIVLTARVNSKQL